MYCTYCGSIASENEICILLWLLLFLPRNSLGAFDNSPGVNYFLLNIRERFIKICLNAWTPNSFNVSVLPRYIIRLSGIAREVPICRPISDIAEIAQQKAAFWAWWDHLDVVGEKKRFHMDTTREVVEKLQEYKCGECSIWAFCRSLTDFKDLF